MARLPSLLLVWWACGARAAAPPTRRSFANGLAAATALGGGAAPPARAGRVEALIAAKYDGAEDLFAPDEVEGAVARAVTQSPLGIDVRRAVVRGAQLFDAQDARWDQLSFAVNRNRAAAPPRPPPAAVDPALAAALARGGDAACAAAARVSPAAVAAEAAAARATFAPVFEAKYPGAAAASSAAESPGAFAFDVYCRFRAYNALLASPEAASAFEADYGARLVALAGARPPTDAHRSPGGPRGALAGCEEILAALGRGGLYAACDATFPDPEDVADLATFDGWGDASDAARPAPVVQISAVLRRPAELPARLLLEGQARRLGLRVLPDAAATALRAYLARCGARPVVEEYFVDDAYRTAFDRDSYGAIQVEAILN